MIRRRWQMYKMKKISPALLFLTLLTLMVSPVYSAFATIDQVIISAPSSASIGQTIQVQATVSTKRSGWGTCTVRDVRAVLILPEGATVTSDNNQILIGNMNGGTSTTVSWTVKFEKSGTHTLQVRVSGYDSNGNSCTASQSTTIVVSGGSPPPSSTPLQLQPSLLYVVLIAIGIALMVILASALMLRKHKSKTNKRV